MIGLRLRRSNCFSVRFDVAHSVRTGNGSIGHVSAGVHAYSCGCLPPMTLTKFQIYDSCPVNIPNLFLSSSVRRKAEIKINLVECPTVRVRDAYFTEQIIIGSRRIIFERLALLSDP